MLMLTSSAQVRLQYRAEAEGGLDGSHVVLAPIPLRNFLLTDRDTLPIHSHHRDPIDIILLEFDLERAEVSCWPLCKPPLLVYLGQWAEFGVLSTDVSAEDLKFAADFSTLEEFRRPSCEGSDTLRVCEGLIELLRCCAELYLIGKARDVHVAG